MAWKEALVSYIVLGHSAMLDSLWPMDCSPPGSSVHGDSPGKSTRVGCCFLLQGIFLTQGLNPGLLHCMQIFLLSELPGKTHIIYKEIRKNLKIKSRILESQWLTSNNDWMLNQNRSGKMGTMIHGMEISGCPRDLIPKTSLNLQNLHSRATTLH